MCTISEALEESPKNLYLKKKNKQKKTFSDSDCKINLRSSRLSNIYVKYHSNLFLKHLANDL